MTENELLERFGTGLEHLSSAMTELAKIHSKACEDRYTRLRWTEQDVEDAKAIKRLCPDAEMVARVGGDIKLFDEDKAFIVFLDGALFPNLEEGEEIYLDYIIIQGNAHGREIGGVK